MPNEYDPNNMNQGPMVVDKPSMVLNILSCCIPLLGLILFIVWKDQKPNSAKQVGIWALVGFILGILAYAAVFFLGILGAATMPYYY